MGFLPVLNPGAIVFGASKHSKPSAILKIFEITRWSQLKERSRNFVLRSDKVLNYMNEQALFQ